MGKQIEESFGDYESYKKRVSEIQDRCEILTTFCNRRSDIYEITYTLPKKLTRGIK